MAKGSVRKKGKKWYYRFYIEDASGNPVQKEFPGTESKSETETMLRKAMEEYESKKFVAISNSVTVGEMLDMWAEEELKPGPLSNNTVSAYIDTIRRIKRHPLGSRKLKTVSAKHLQEYMDLLSFGGQNPNGTQARPLAIGTIRPYSAVLRNAFRFAVFPKQLLSFNPMDYVVWRHKDEDYELFSPGQDSAEETYPTITYEQYMKVSSYLTAKKNPALLPIQIAYYTGLRIGEVCGLTWQDIDLTEQCLTVRRSMRYNSLRKKTEIGPTKRRKVRTVDFCDTLAAILKEARREQMLNSMKCGPLYHQNYYQTVKEKNRTYYDLYTLQRSVKAPETYTGISFVCLRMDGSFESASTVGLVCRTIKKKVPGLDDFHFHALRHTFTTNLISNGASVKDVQELLGHAKADTTLNIYAHSSQEAKRTSARLLDKVAEGR